jgi:uncharacterized membrane protein YphA (DoxX/SURF4 family)
VSSCIGGRRLLTLDSVSAARALWLAVGERDLALRRDRLASRTAVLTGVIFIFAGLVKFAFHHWELKAFRAFGLPWPGALEILAGILETAGGVLLTMRRFVVPAASLLAVTMAVAVAASGIGHGDVIPSLTLAPALLVAMVFLLVRAPARSVTRT